MPNETVSKKCSKQHSPRKKHSRARHIAAALLPFASFAAVPQNPFQFDRQGPETENKDDHLPFCPSESKKCILEEKHDDDDDPGYSTVQEFSQECGSSHNSALTPSVPPKNIESLYAKVQKKRVKSTSVAGPSALTNLPETLNLPSHSLATDETRNDKSSVVKAEPFEKAEHLSCEKSEEIETKVEELQTWNLLKYQQASQLPPKLKITFPALHSVSTAQEERGFEENLCEHSKDSHLQEQVSQDSLTHLNSQFSNLSAVKLNSPHNSAYRNLEESASQNGSRGDLENANKMLQEYQEEIWLLQQKFQEVVEENKILHKHISSLLENESKWKEELAKAKQSQQENLTFRKKSEQLRQKVIQLEIQYEREVNSTANQLKSIQAEKSHLLEQLHSLHHEYESLRHRYTQTRRENVEMVSAEQHIKTVKESQKLLEEVKKRYQEEIDKIQEHYRSADDQKTRLSLEVQHLKNDMEQLQHDNKLLADSRQQVLKKNDLLLYQLEKSKQQESETQELLAALLRLTEETIAERDVAVIKSQFHDNQQKQMQTTVMEHTFGVGRFQEHIKNIRQKVNDEIRQVQMSVKHKDTDWDRVKQTYERQLDILRHSLLQKHQAMDALDKEKRNLEIDLENMWQTVCGGNRIIQ